MKRKTVLFLVALCFTWTTALPVLADQIEDPAAPVKQSLSDYQAFRSNPDSSSSSSESVEIRRQRPESGEQNLLGMISSEPEASPGCLQLISRWPYGPTYTVITSGNYAYYGRGAVFTIADKSNVASWKIIGESDVRGPVNGIVLNGTRAYVAAGQAGLKVIDISDPRTPVIVRSVPTAGEAGALAILSNCLYLADGASGLLIFDVSNPALPVLISSFDTPGTAFGVTIFGRNAYVADGPQGLRIVDISDPSSPVFVSRIYTEDAHDVRVSKNEACVADGTGGLKIINVSNPATPEKVRSLNTAGTAVALSLSGGYAFLADGFNGLRIIDTSYPYTVAAIPSYDFTSDVSLSGGYAYVADRSTVQVLDIGAASEPKRVAAWLGYGNAWGTALAGDHLYLADGDSGLIVFDVSASYIIETGYCGTPGFAYDVAVAGSHAYVADATGLQIIDVSDPTKPVAIGSFNSSGTASSVALSGKYAYVANGSAGLKIVDISNAASPTLVGSSNASVDAFGVAVSGDYAYVADGTTGLRIINIANPTSPAEVGFCDTPGTAFGVAVSGHYAYVADFDSGLHIVDVSNPKSPAIVATVPTGGLALRVVVAGGYAYVGAGPAGLQVINVSNPTTPVPVGNASTAELATGVALAGDRVYVADAGCGFYVFSGCGIVGDCPTVAIQSVSAASCPKVKVKVEVTNSTGQPVTGLTAGAFTLSEDGVAKALTSTVLPTAGQYELSYISAKNDGTQHALDVGATANSCNRHATGSFTLCAAGSATGYEADVAPRDSGDGAVNSADWAQVGRFAAGLDSAAAGNEFSKADCAPRSSLGNGAITTVDWVQAARYASGLDPLTNVGGPISTTAQAAGSSLVSGIEAATDPRSLAMTQISATSGQTMPVPILLQSAGDEKAFGFSVSFDASLLTFTGATVGSGATGASLHLNDSQKANGKLGVLIGFSGSQKFRAGQRQLLVLNFKAATVTTIRSGTISFGDQPALREVSDVAASVLPCAYFEGNVAVTTASPIYTQQLVFPQFVDGGGMTTRFAIFASPNLADAVVGRIRFFNSDATARSVTAGGITGTERRFSLSPHGSQFSETAGIGEQAIPGWALVETTGTVHGMAGFEFRSGETLVFSASALGVPPSRKLAIPVEDAVKTGVAIVNPGDAPINVKLTLIQKSGTQTEMSPTSLNPLGARKHLPQFVNEMTGQADFQGTLVIEVVGDGSVAATGLYMNGGVLSGLPVVIVQ